MTAGTVIKTRTLEDCVWIVCADQTTRSETAFYVERDQQAEAIRSGDHFWMQGGFAMWTPARYVDFARRRMLGRLRCGTDYDIELKIKPRSSAVRPDAKTGYPKPEAGMKRDSNPRCDGSEIPPAGAIDPALVFKP